MSKKMAFLSFFFLYMFSAISASLISMWITKPETIASELTYGLGKVAAVFLILSPIALYCNKECRKMYALLTLLIFPMFLSMELLFDISDLADPGVHLYVILVAAVAITIAVIAVFYRMGMFARNATDATVFGKRKSQC